MNTVLRLSLGLLLAASMVGCNSCGHQSCMHKAVNNGCGCGSHEGGGCDTDSAACDCGRRHTPRIKHRRSKSKMLPDAVAHGYDGSVVYTGEDWQGIPQQAPPMMGAPYSGGCSGCGGGQNIYSTPTAGGCSGCGGGPVSAPPAQGGGCASCGGGAPPQMPQTIPSSGGCASCGGSGGNEAFYSPLSPNHSGPAPAPPAEGIPGHNESSPGDKAVNQGETIQKINWVPRQL